LSAELTKTHFFRLFFGRVCCDLLLTRYAYRNSQLHCPPHSCAMELLWTSHILFYVKEVVNHYAHPAGKTMSMFWTIFKV